MRILALAMFAGLAACAVGGGPPAPAPAASVFPAERGTAPRPPTEAAAGHRAPPEGVGPGGIDFGQWRQAAPAAYQPRFEIQMRQRFAGKTNAEIRADLERNGFACEDAARLDCRIEIMERQCAIDWYVVVEPNRAEPVAGFDIMCLGAN
jgi:hypothetical protein